MWLQSNKVVWNILYGVFWGVSARDYHCPLLSTTDPAPEPEFLELTEFHHLFFWASFVNFWKVDTSDCVSPFVLMLFL
jgi:hypothetical protein